MQTLWRTTYHAPKTIGRIGHRYASDTHRFAQSDYVLLQPTSQKNETPIFLGPLTYGSLHNLHKGSISHDSIIGKAVRDVVDSTKPNSKRRTQFRLQEVRLEDYVLLSRRIVTPIYPHDANLIVSLFDLHPEPVISDSRDGKPQIEILEAGTGAGSLTLHLSRAVHAANGPAPKLGTDSTEAEREDAVRAWKKSRQAIVHSIEVSEKHSKHASMTVRGFRRGQYLGNVDFHVQGVSEWIKQAMEERSGVPFLTHAFLDLPGVEHNVAATASALKTNGMLIMFCPSITQINQCALGVRKNKVPLHLDRVIELGVNGGTGGRLWDIRLVKPRASRQNSASMSERVADGTKEQAQADVEACVDILPDDGNRETQVEPAAAPPSPSPDDDWQMVCRPKVGDRITGGGFLAVFRKKSQDDTQDSLEAELS
ncbi:hypothetical protein AMS68_003324 [Peltaster fructicola]|uniref:tRNA (adenine(58)-N(1))-methyltransferase catalytic subunit TRM61 n=1 Tax=Peltaster fructicola TaxID=286661 RepID=A0A6H0XSR7_9PEZI|nr:hypothetical protein AMS68_003324 [Peltaster fructicola]